MWWDESRGTLHVRGALPDVMGAELEEAVHRVAESMSPAAGEPWAPLGRRACDAVHQLCTRVHAPDEASACSSFDGPSGGRKPLLVVEVPRHGPATVAGIALPDSMVEQLRANAMIEPVLVDDDGTVAAIGRRAPALSEKITRAIRLRDGHCRWPGCDVRHGLEIHHLVPRSWGGTDDPANLAATCKVRGHHQALVPHGPLVLAGNPNRPDGLVLVRYDELTDDQAWELRLPPPRRHRGP